MVFSAAAAGSHLVVQSRRRRWAVLHRHSQHLKRALLLGSCAAASGVHVLAICRGDSSAKIAAAPWLRIELGVASRSGCGVLREKFGLLEAGVGLAIGATVAHERRRPPDRYAFFASH